MTKVYITYFVHGTTPDNENDMASGWSDVSLSELGKRQCYELKKTVKDKKFDVIVCSDMKRAVETAEIVWGGQVPIVKDNRLRECNLGDLNGAPGKEFNAIYENCIDSPFPNGESYRQLEKRMRSLLDDMAKNYAGKHVAFVAHQGPQLALDVILKGKTWEQAMKEDWRLKVPKEWRPGWDYVLEG